ncbi:hypothetical protein JCM24511_09939 [Saitozyma sp. JCM 24511]|nr:hypothetical protein JCM24511_09939 [Saitozyma sp. JCM 24511]
MTAFDQNALASLSPYEVAFFNTHCTGRMTTVPFELIHSSFEHHARLAPDVVAVEHASQGESITFGDLDRAANALAHRLRSQGIVPGQRVCILSKRSVANVIAVLSVLKAGGQYVPLDSATITDETLAHVLVDSGAALVLCMGDYLHRVSGVPVVPLEEAIRETEGGDHSKPEELARGSDGVYVIYTSGTTGKPKGVDVRHSGVTNCNVGMKPGMRVAQLLNVAFDMGAWELLGAMSNGCTLCLRGLKSAQWRSVLKTVDIVIATPSVLAPHHPADYPTIKHVITGGEPCPQELADRWSRYTNFNNCCGPTEISIANTVQPHRTGERVSIGRPVPNTTLYVLDDALRPCKVGEMGTMWVGGAGVSRGYLNLPDRTAERYRLDPFVNDGRMMFNTGDLGKFREDGQLDHLGRADDQVKVKGFRVELDGVSAAMQTCSGVDLAVALLVGSELWGFVTPETATGEAVQEATARLQPYYAVPAKYIALPRFPHTGNGKVDKRSLRALAAQTEVPPLSPIRSTFYASVPTMPVLDTSSSRSPTLSSGLMTPRLDDSFVFQDSASASKEPSFWAASPEPAYSRKSSYTQGSYMSDVDVAPN